MFVTRLWMLVWHYLIYYFLFFQDFIFHVIFTFNRQFLTKCLAYQIASAALASATAVSRGRGRGTRCAPRGRGRGRGRAAPGGSGDAVAAARFEQAFIYFSLVKWEKQTAMLYFFRRMFITFTYIFSVTKMMFIFFVQITNLTLLPNANFVTFIPQGNSWSWCPRRKRMAESQPWHFI